MKTTKIPDQLMEWLMSGDPAICYQVQRDLLESSPEVVKETRNIIALKGWGKRFLDMQDEKGMWGGGLYGPKWISTFYTLQTLMDIGMEKNREIEKALMLILDKGFAEDGGINLWKWPHSETCVTGMFLSICCRFEMNDDRLNGMAAYIMNEQMPDGGWNCRKHLGDTHSSFHTTVSVLEGLLNYEKFAAGRNKSAIRTVRGHGVELLLQHRLFRSHRTGEIFDPKITRFSFPYRWRYDVMRVMDHLRDCKALKDERMQEAVELIRSKQGADGRWKLQQKHAGRVFFDMETPGEPSRWNTLRALRILGWWDQAGA